MDLKQLGLRIKELRKKRGLTQEELSELSGINSKHLSEVERGVINVSIQNLARIAAALGTYPQCLLETAHHQPREALRADIEAMLDLADDDQLRSIHRIVSGLIM